MRAVNIVKSMVWIALFAGISAAGVKNVAVVETEIDEQSGVSAKLTRSEVRQITTELRREAVKNLPRDKYNIMTSETVQAQGSAVLAECADENCVITLGSKIGADYIVRGIVSKLKAKLTLAVEIYETENGNLVASSDAVRSESIEVLIEKTAVACAAMYKTFIASQSTMPQPKTYTPAPNEPPSDGHINVNSDTKQTYTLTTNVFPLGWGSVTRNPNKDTYASGEMVTVSATAYKGCVFAGWTGETTNKASGVVIITMDGDKALTANFHGQPAASSSTGANEGMEGYYINVVMPLLASPPLAGEWAGIEGGWFGINRLAYGFEFGGGVFGDSHNTSNPLTGIGRKESIGGGFNISHMGKRLVLGLSTGYWYGRFELENYSPPLRIIRAFGGPFVKLRCWRVCEFTYRGLIGYEQEGIYDSKNSTFVSDTEKEFTWASQFKFGLHFEIARGSTQR
jgi:hypothetical protein